MKARRCGPSHEARSYPTKIRIGIAQNVRAGCVRRQIIEAEVLLWVSQGKSNADVATILGMSDKTVKQHMGVVFQKLGVEGRAAATLCALEILSNVSR